MPKSVLIELPEAPVEESAHQVEWAIVNSGFTRPQDRIVINLAPAQIAKTDGSACSVHHMGILAGGANLSAKIDSEPQRHHLRVHRMLELVKWESATCRTSIREALARKSMSLPEWVPPDTPPKYQDRNLAVEHRHRNRIAGSC